RYRRGHARFHHASWQRESPGRPAPVRDGAVTLRLSADGQRRPSDPDRTASYRQGHARINFAYAGLITSLIRTRRSSEGVNELFIALMVNHCRSAQPYPNASTSRASSRDTDVRLMSRLSVLTVTRKASSRSSPMG